MATSAARPCSYSSSKTGSSAAWASAGPCCLSRRVARELCTAVRAFVLALVEFVVEASAVRELSFRNRLRPNRENRKNRTDGGVAIGDHSCLSNLSFQVSSQVGHLLRSIGPRSVLSLGFGVRAELPRRYLDRLLEVARARHGRGT